jgi:transcriptional regulator with XRE-family HTH domain
MSSVKNMTRFGETLRRLRKERNLTQAALAEQIGVSHVYVSALERSAKPAPRHAIVLAIAQCLGVDEDVLWASARDERETRLRDRVQGQPTSLRRPKAEDKGNHQILPSEERILRKLRAVTSDQNDRERVIQILETLIDSLKE